MRKSLCRRLPSRAAAAERRLAQTDGGCRVFESALLRPSAVARLGLGPRPCCTSAGASLAKALASMVFGRYPCSIELGT